MTNDNNISSSSIWIDPVLQGLAYWIGYKKELYRHHLLNEGAIVSEITTLMSSSMNANQRVGCEVQYSDISKKINGSERADIVGYLNGKIDFVIEVKKYESVKRLIDADLIKLSKVKDLNKEIRCFLLLVSQRKPPFPFINDNGNANRLRFPISGLNLKFKTIRVCKSVSSFKENAYLRANYTCLVEVIH